MKFSKVLETECIPEWRKAYVQYKGLKKLLKNVEKVRKVSEQKAALELAHPMFHDEDDDLDGFHQSGLTCCTQPWSLWRPSTSMSVIRQWTSSRRGDLFIPCSHSVWDEVLLHANDSERQFFALLDRELDKVSVFYNDYGQHLLEIGPPLSPYPALFQSRHHRNVPSFVGSASDPHISYSVARNRLKKALTEFYRSLEYLGSYKKLNQLGCQKILKKFDKVSGWKASHIYMDRIKKRH
ncbi:SPX-domain-containing protein [Hesseltinella vesiculosa]|uniref:SPX-domain-containing protein n=1 Tax=Hesseltinella vesiculosa TaxID=101127 RepID=A0A1X2G6F5_9FUNG|nr:SPX-domain-containing protein [Hesseltinella vesiculosa]